MKRLLALILVALFLLAFAACGASAPETMDDPLKPTDGVKPDGDQDSTPPDNDSSKEDQVENDEPSHEDEPNQSQDEDEPDQSVSDITLVQSGSFKGEGDIALHLYVEWSAVQKATDKDATVTVDLYLSHYRLSVKSRSGNTVTVNEQVHTFSTDPIVCEENVQTRTKLTTYTLSVPRDANQKVSVDIDAVWKFSGVLSGEFVDQIRATSTITLG